MIDIKIPEIGENIKSGTISGILIKIGDNVRKGQDIVELETDKATVPIPSSADGIVKEILIKPGQKVDIGAVIVRLEGQAATQAPSAPKPATQAKASVQPTQASIPPPQKPTSQPAQPAQATPQPAAPAAKDINLVVIGGGPGGYAAAFLAADLGLNITLIDKDVNPGGVCLYRGCIPSKALLHAAKILSESKEAKNFGIEFAAPKIDIDKLRSWKNTVVNQLTGGLGQMVKMRKVKYIQGTAKFTNSTTLKIKKSDGSEQSLNFDKAILATGSRPRKLPNAPDSKRVLDSTSALEIENVPKSLLLIGGGYIGLELGTVYAELGTEVSVVEVLPELMAGADRDVASILERRLKKIFKEIMVNTKVTKMVETKTGIKVTFEDQAGKTKEQEYEKVLVAIGRQPNSEDLGLETTKVKVNNKGFIEVNSQLQTADPAIFAIGDLTGNPMLAHKASHAGRVAVEVIAGHKVVFEPKAIPAVVFTDPEIAWAGLTETEAKAKGIEVQVAKFPWGASGRAITLDRTDGLTKLLIDPTTERILGVSIVGPGAGELIAEGVLAIEMGANATDLKLSIHPHPTLTETLMESAESFYGQATHIYKPKR